MSTVVRWATVTDMVSDATTVHDIENVLGNAGFWYALAVAAAGTAIVWLRTHQGEVTPGIGIVVALAGVVGWRTEHPLSGALVVALGLLALGEWLGRDGSVAVRGVVLVPGAIILGAALPDGWPFWVRVVAAVAAVAGGLLAVEADRRVPRLVPLLLAIGAVGVYACVPDTEAPTVLLGAVAAAAAIGLEPRLRHSFGWPAAVGLFTWAVAVGGVGRAGSVVGGIGCLGVVLLLAAVRWTRRAGWPVVALVVVQVGLVAFEARVVGFEESGWRALALSVPAFAVAGLMLLAIRAWRGR